MNILGKISVAICAFIAISCSLSAQAPDFTKAAENTINGVVSIKCYATPRGYGFGSDPFSDPFFEYFFGQRRQPQKKQEQEQQQTGLGSGVIISKDGYIVTNNHVINGAERLEIILNDKRTFNATVVGTDSSTDIALIKIDASDLHPIAWGNSDDLKIGEWVLAVGNPFSLTSTVTAGIVSAKARNISQITQGHSMGIESYIQTDAAVNPGNSGGALVNLNGELVGINTAIYSKTGNYVGYSFAIPSTIVKKIVGDIKEYGAVQRAMLGISFTELSSKQAKEKNITAVNSGIYVAKVEDRSAAFEGGIKEGDVIVAINGMPTHTTAQMQEQMNKFRPGDKVSVTYIRDNKEKTITVTLRNSQGETSLIKASDIFDLGCAFKEVPAETLKQLEISSGVQVVGLKDGKFKNAGIKEGCIILEISNKISNKKVTSKEDIEKMYNEIMNSNSPDKVMFITGIYPTGKKEYYVVPLTN